MRPDPKAVWVSVADAVTKPDVMASHGTVMPHQTLRAHRNAGHGHHIIGGCGGVGSDHNVVGPWHKLCPAETHSSSCGHSSARLVTRGSDNKGWTCQQGLGGLASMKAEVCCWRLQPDSADTALSQQMLSVSCSSSSI